MATVRFGIIGCGGIANHFHLKDLAGIPEAELLACADVRPEAARATAERWGAKGWYTDHRELLAREDIDAVIVATHHPTHAAIGCDVLEAEKHLLVQKPLTTTLADADRLVEAAARSSRKTMCLPYNWTSPYRCALRLLESGAIGRVCQIRRRIAHSGPPRDSWFYNPDVAQFGALFDMGVYAVSGITGLAGPAVSASGLVRTLEAGVRIDDNAIIQLEFASGAIGHAETSWTQVATRECTVIYGDEGTIVLPESGEGLEFISRKQKVLRQADWFRPQLPPTPRDAAHRHFVRCILEDRPPLGTPEHARHVVEIMLAAAESSRTDQRVGLATTFELPGELTE
jgi:predicted dehydrogenase